MNGKTTTTWDPRELDDETLGIPDWTKGYRGEEKGKEKEEG